MFIINNCFDNSHGNMDDGTSLILTDLRNHMIETQAFNVSAEGKVALITKINFRN